MRALNLFLLCLTILALMVYFIPKPELCWIPPHADTRGIYADCWTFNEVVL